MGQEYKGGDRNPGAFSFVSSPSCIVRFAAANAVRLVELPFDEMDGLGGFQCWLGWQDSRLASVAESAGRPTCQGSRYFSVDVDMLVG